MVPGAQGQVLEGPVRRTEESGLRSSFFGIRGPARLEVGVMKLCVAPAAPGGGAGADK